MSNSDVMNHLDIRKGPPDIAGRPESKRSYEDDVCSINNTENDNFQQAGYVAELVLERLREDHRWFLGHAVACENLGRALVKGVISTARALTLRNSLMGDVQPYVEEFCTLVEQKRAEYVAQQNRGRRRDRGRS